MLVLNPSKHRERNRKEKCIGEGLDGLENSDVLGKRVIPGEPENKCADEYDEYENENLG
jgi:hypothetical protein